MMASESVLFLDQTQASPLPLWKVLIGSLREVDTPSFFLCVVVPFSYLVSLSAEICVFSSPFPSPDHSFLDDSVLCSDSCVAAPRSLCI